MKKTVDDYLKSVDYNFSDYIPSDEALMFVNFIKDVNGGAEENETPLFHLMMLDSIFNKKRRHAFMVFRGSGKTSLFAEYLILFIATLGYLPNFGKVNLMMYITDSIENGVKNLRRNIEYRYNNSEFLQQMIPNKKIEYTINGIGRTDVSKVENDTSKGGIKFTDIRLEFMNRKGQQLVVKGYGVKSGIRGVKELGQRPAIAIADDLINDEDARSDLVIESVNSIMYKAVAKALHPTKQKIIWLGTPFNKKDPLYRAVESGVWHSCVFPICEKFPCDKKDFKGAWEDRFPYEYVKSEYEEAIATGNASSFYQELMLQILSDEDRLLSEQDIVWYDINEVIKHKSNFNFYVTTDFATSEKKHADYSVISVWAVDSEGNYRYVDGIIKKQYMDKNINDLFRFVQMYNPMEVGIEISGQQGAFIQWLDSEMRNRKIYFNLASNPNTRLDYKNTQLGIRPIKSKIERFNLILPYFKQKKIWFPESIKNTTLGNEIVSELFSITVDGIKSRHDDFIDTVSMLASLRIIIPTNIKNSEKKLDLSDYYSISEDMDNYSIFEEDKCYL